MSGALSEASAVAGDSRFGFGEIGMFVARDWRGRGVCSALVAAAIEWGPRTWSAQVDAQCVSPQRGSDRALSEVRIRG